MRRLPMFTVLVLALAGCANQTSAAPAASTDSALPDRDPALAHKLVASGAVLIDVRTPDEFQARHIEGAVNIPVDDLASRMSEVQTLTSGDSKKPIVVYCHSGNRAGRAKKVLEGKGYSQVTNLGGIDDWDRH